MNIVAAIVYKTFYFALSRRCGETLGINIEWRSRSLSYSDQTTRLRGSVRE